jgi:hypothetical protein
MRRRTTGESSRLSSLPERAGSGASDAGASAAGAGAGSAAGSAVASSAAGSAFDSSAESSDVGASCASPSPSLLAPLPSGGLSPRTASTAPTSTVSPSGTRISTR